MACPNSQVVHVLKLLNFIKPVWVVSKSLVLNVYICKRPGQLTNLMFHSSLFHCFSYDRHSLENTTTSKVMGHTIAYAAVLYCLSKSAWIWAFFVIHVQLFTGLYVLSIRHCARAYKKLEITTFKNKIKTYMYRRAYN